MTIDATKGRGALPVDSPTVSYWQAEAGDSVIHNHGRLDALPTSDGEGAAVDVAIVGSGISGAVAAYELQQQAPHLSIAMLEAREACSGATGRNGGHCRPDLFLGFERYSAILGKEQAHKVLLNEWETLELTRSIIEKEGIDCDWWQGLTTSAFLDAGIMAQAEANFESYSKYTSLRPGVRFVKDAGEAAELTRIPQAVGAAVSPAGSLYPLRFVHALLSLCLSRGNFQLFTHTPVHGLHRQGPSHWSVETNRGPFTARKVLIATNGYSRALLPSLDDFLLSRRAHCSSITPPSAYRGANRLQNTCVAVRSNKDYEYLVQRQGKDDAFILGGGHSILNREQELGVYDDSQLDPALPAYFAAYPHKHFADWKEADGQLTHTWTGIQGYTRDSVPIVGQSFEEDDLFLCLGHQGHGMARAATCARGVAHLILSSNHTEQTDEEWEQITRLPSCYRWTQKRAKRRDVDCRSDF